MAERSKAGTAGTGRAAVADETATSRPGARTGTSTGTGTTGTGATTATQSQPQPAWQPGATEAGTASAAGGAEAQQPTFIGRVQQRASERIREQQNRTTEGMTTIAHAVRDASAKLRSERHESIAEYVDRAAAQLDRLSEYVKRKDGAELWRDAQTYARRRPAIFVGSAFVIGLCAARFLKSSNPRASSRPAWQRMPAGSGERTTGSQQGMA